MFDELGIGDVIDQATPQNPETRFVTVGQAVKAMVLNGLGIVNRQLYLMSLFFQNKPTHRLMAPGIEAQHLNDETLGRALDTLYAYVVADLYSLIAVTAARHLRLTPRFTHLDSTSLHVDGRDNSAEEPDAHIIHITRGYSRDHRPALHWIMLDLIVEHQAGIPLLMKPRSGLRQLHHLVPPGISTGLQLLEDPIRVIADLTGTLGARLEIRGDHCGPGDGPAIGCWPLLGQDPLCSGNRPVSRCDARPYPIRVINVTRPIWPSHCPVLPGKVKTALRGSSSCRNPGATA
jgi:hypothetical protein